VQKRSGKIEKFLTKDEKAMVEQAIADSEKLTGAEIKVIILRHCWVDIRDKALQLFRKYELDKTQERNCVLILLVTSNREFIIYGDKGIYEQTPEDFWTHERNIMGNYFSKDQFGEGLTEAVRNVGKKLAELYPCRKDDTDEIGNDVCFEE